MTYREHSTLPAYAQLTWDEKGKPIKTEGALMWGGKGVEPPAIGSEIVVTINGCGPAIVTGYFEEGGFLGLMCRLTNPPEWHVKQNNGNPNGHVFGPEFRLP